MNNVTGNSRKKFLRSTQDREFKNQQNILTDDCTMQTQIHLDPDLEEEDPESCCDPNEMVCYKNCLYIDVMYARMTQIWVIMMAIIINVHQP